VWVTQSEENFFKYQEVYEKNLAGICTFGWLTASIASYKSYDKEGYMENLPSDVIWREQPLHPIIQIHESDHQLYHDQQNGLTWQKAIEIAHEMMH